MKVVYKNVPGYPGYRAGTDGSIWSRWRTCQKGTILTNKWRKLKPSVKRNKTTGRIAYLYLNLVRDGKARTFRAHAVILNTFAGPCPEGFECRHLDNDPTNNHWPENIKWDTREANLEDCVKFGSYSNKMRNVMITYQDKTQSLKDWARELDISYAVLFYRVRKSGIPFEEAITIPVGNNGGSRKRPGFKE